MQLYVINEAII